MRVQFGKSRSEHNKELHEQENEATSLHKKVDVL